MRKLLGVLAAVSLLLAVSCAVLGTSKKQKKATKEILLMTF